MRYYILDVLFFYFFSILETKSYICTETIVLIHIDVSKLVQIVQIFITQTLDRIGIALRKDVRTNSQSTKVDFASSATISIVVMS